MSLNTDGDDPSIANIGTQAIIPLNALKSFDTPPTKALFKRASRQFAHK
jgi:hypothetical protein